MGISGFVGRADFWPEIGAQWLARLREDNVSYFHATDAWTRRPGTLFGDRIYWTCGQRDLLFSDLGKLIGSAGIAGISSAVSRVAWDEVWSNFASRRFQRRYPHPYHFCFEHCLQQILGWRQENAPGVEMLLTFAEDDERQKWAAQIGDAYKKAEVTDKMSVEFDSPKRVVPLQIADFLAFGVKKMAVEGDSEWWFPIQKIISRQASSYGGMQLHGGYFGRDELVQYVRRTDSSERSS